MGKNNAAVKQWLGNRRRFADLFNGVIFGGEQIVLADDLEMTDSEANILDVEKGGKAKEIRRHRDIVMKWTQGAELVVLACENQEKVHYAMPVRGIVYDGLSYTEQIQRLWDTLSSEEKKNISDEEFLSRFRKTDKLYPVITIVLYYGKEKWDGNMELYEMFEDSFKENLEKIKQYIPNYRINMIDVGNSEEIERFQTDLQDVFGMLKYRDNKVELMKYLNRKSEYFRHVDRDTYYAIRAFLNSEKMLKEKIEINKEETDMCQALQDLYDEGIEKGVESERENTINHVKAMVEAGEITIEKVKQFFDFTTEELEKLQEI